MRKIRRGDEVIVISGRNKGQTGTVRTAMTDQDRVVVEGVNIIVKHIKAGRARQAGRVEVEGPLHISNVMLVCPTCKKPTRVGVRRNEAGKNGRFCKECDATITPGEL
jgi:large subunit ribosomal protein L24